MHHQPRRQQPSTLLPSAGLLHHLIDQLRRDTLLNKPTSTRPRAAAPCTTGIGATTFSLFRARLVVHDADQSLFAATVAKAVDKGVLAGSLTAIVDSSPVRGAGAVADTYELLRGLLVRVARAGRDRVEAGWPAGSRSWPRANQTWTGRTRPPARPILPSWSAPARPTRNSHFLLAHVEPKPLVKQVGRAGLEPATEGL